MLFSALRAFFAGSDQPTAPESTLDALLKQRIILLGLPIDDAVANDIIAKLLFLEMDSPTKPIRLMINSPGGLVLAGLAIMDTIDQIRPPVSTHCLGQAHSMAAVILACGSPNSRSAESGSIISFSLPKTSAADATNTAKQADAVRLGEILIAKTATATGDSISEIRQLFQDGAVLSAEEAIRHGIIDRVSRAAPLVGT